VSYTALALIGVGLSVLLDLVVLRTNLLRHRNFWTAYVIVLFFQLIVNGILTGRRVVTYNSGDVIGGRTPEFLGDGRFVYAPVEDLLFGFAMVLQTLAWWVWWGRRLSVDDGRGRRAPAPERRPRAGGDSER
jgi:lycopene cyclase domain-containing protein